MENKSLFEQATIWKSRWDNRFIIKYQEDYKVATLDIQKHVRVLSKKIDELKPADANGLMSEDLNKAKEICKEILK